MKDIQDLLLYSLLWHSVGACPRWCQLQQRKKIDKVIVIALKSLGESEYLENTDAFPFIMKEFNDHVCVKFIYFYNIFFYHSLSYFIDWVV